MKLVYNKYCINNIKYKLFCLNLKKIIYFYCQNKYWEYIKMFF